MKTLKEYYHEWMDTWVAHLDNAIKNYQEYGDEYNYQRIKKNAMMAFHYAILISK